MEIEVGAPMFRAIIVKKSMNEHSVILRVRYRRKSFFSLKRKCFDVVVNSADYVSYERYLRYCQIQKLKAGDEIFVDPYGEEWTNPLHHNFLLRQWNLRFA